MEFGVTRALTHTGMGAKTYCFSRRQKSHITGPSIHEQPKPLTQKARQAVSFSMYGLTLKGK